MDVSQAYDQNPQAEWERLARDAYHSLEFDLTLHHLRPHLAPGMLILDAGGGPGRYAIQLCREGFRVALLDVSKELLALARERLADEPPEVRARLVEVQVADVRDLGSIASDTYDATLCLGPLTHLHLEPDRVTALRELVRVTRPAGLVALSVGGWLALLRTLLRLGGGELLDDQAWRRLQEGDALVRGMLWHFFRADELRNLAEDCGLQTLDMVGCQGLSSGLPEATNRLAENEECWRLWRALLLQTAREPAVVDMAEHILYLGRVNKATPRA
jgi:SAM-dependent methyltransferase